MDSDFVVLNFVLATTFLVLFTVCLLYIVVRFKSYFDAEMAVFTAIIQLSLLLNFINMTTILISMWDKQRLNPDESTQIPPEYLNLKGYFMSLDKWFDVANYFQIYLQGVIGFLAY